ncbi:hypothetical protein E2C01_026654 [Portunus trituberculatus]|uniref:Uncharacterized protein n=1 Tax=Portunus trituberculatus TaxID=210409 RepID=A0A5B7EFX0_PORTR|nr:hypothetical protein [Portunus trituberculatus]
MFRVVVISRHVQFSHSPNVFSVGTPRRARDRDRAKAECECWYKSNKRSPGNRKDSGHGALMKVEFGARNFEGCVKMMEPSTRSPRRPHCRIRQWECRVC